MIESFVQTLEHTIQDNAWLAPLAAFVGGLMTAANPCVLAMVPLMVAYVAGQGTRSVGKSFLLSLVFSVGLTVMFFVLYVAALTISTVLQVVWWTYVAAAVCLIMGLHLIGVLTFSIPAPAGVTPKRRGLIGAFLLGLLFGLVSLPCAGPVLVAVVSLSTLGTVKSTAFGSVLLVAYSLGHCCLILVGGTSMGVVQRMADSKGWMRAMDVSRRLAGVVIILIGIWLLAT